MVCQSTRQLCFCFWSWNKTRRSSKFLPAGLSDISEKFADSGYENRLHGGSGRFGSMVKDRKLFCQNIPGSDWCQQENCTRKAGIVQYSMMLTGCKTWIRMKVWNKLLSVDFFHSTRFPPILTWKGSYYVIRNWTSQFQFLSLKSLWIGLPRVEIAFQNLKILTKNFNKLELFLSLGSRCFFVCNWLWVDIQVSKSEIFCRHFSSKVWFFRILPKAVSWNFVSFCQVLNQIVCVIFCNWNLNFRFFFFSIKNCWKFFFNFCRVFPRARFFAECGLIMRRNRSRWIY